MNSISKKEIIALYDQIKLEQFLIQKFKSSAEETKNPTLKAKLELLTAKHQLHYDKLIAILNEE